MEKKYEFTDETLQHFGITLHRIKALRSFGGIEEGELGGFIEKEENLAHDNGAWVRDNAIVYDGAVIYDNALVSGNAHVFGHACVADSAHVYGNATVCGYSNVRKYAQVFGNAQVNGNVRVYDAAQVYGTAQIGNITCVCGAAKVCGEVKIYDNAQFYDNAYILSNNDYLSFTGLGSKNRSTTFFKCKDGTIKVKCGCFGGTLKEFEKIVKETHGDSKYAKEYLACLEVVRIHFEIGDLENA